MHGVVVRHHVSIRRGAAFAHLERHGFVSSRGALKSFEPLGTIVFLFHLENVVLVFVLRLGAKLRWCEDDLDTVFTLDVDLLDGGTQQI